jgi:hypothetical protein
MDLAALAHLDVDDIEVVEVDHLAAASARPGIVAPHQHPTARNRLDPPLICSPVHTHAVGSPLCGPVHTHAVGARPDAA